MAEIKDDNIKATVLKSWGCFVSAGMAQQLRASASE